jgi:hypothetical protein
MDITCSAVFFFTDFTNTTYALVPVPVLVVPGALLALVPVPVLALALVLVPLLLSLQAQQVSFLVPMGSRPT